MANTCFDTHLDYFCQRHKRLNEKKVISELLFLTGDGLTTPEYIDPVVREFCERISPGFSPVFLDCLPEPWSRQHCCNLNVEHYIERHGGELLSGHIIWYHPGVFLLSEPHAVWKKEDLLRDVSFRDSGEDRILFLPSSTPKTFDPRAERTFQILDRTYLHLQRPIDVMESMYKERRIQTKSQAWSEMPTYKQFQQIKRTVA